MQIDLDKIRPSPFQPRLEFDLEDLKGPIIKDGIVDHLIVRQVDDYYELIDGERRWRIAEDLGYETVSCDVIEADDEKADRLVWELNQDRKQYAPKEKAFHYKMHQEEGLTVSDISRIHGEDRKMIYAYFNVLSLPQKYQNLVWTREIGIGIIEKMQPLFTQRVVNHTEILKLLDRAATEKHFGQRQIEKILQPWLEEQANRVKEAGQELAKTIKPEVIIETPEDYEKAAEVLKREAKKRREAELTPEQRMEIQAKKQSEEEEKKRKQELKKEQENIRIRKEAEEIAKRELLEDEKFRKEVKSDLSRSDVEGIKAIENNSILTEYDKKTLIGLIRKGEIRGKQQIDRWHETYRMHRTKVPKPRPEQEMKRREIEEHLLDIAKGGEHLANLIMMLAGQVSSYPETLELFPPKETMKANSAMADLRRAIRDYHEKCEMAKSKLRKKGVLKEV